MSSVDGGSRLDLDIFSYRVTKDNRVFILWHGKHVTTLAGKKAESFIKAIAGAAPKEAQLLMARVTGNFKRGNERQGKL